MKEDSFWSALQGARLSRRRLIGSAALGGAGLAAAAVIGCGGDDNEEAKSSQGAAPQEVLKHGSFTMAANASSFGQTLSPNSTAGNFVDFYALFDPLTRLNENIEAVPALASSWEVDKSNQSRWIFHLRDAQWSDGKPFTAEDVKFTFDYIANPDSKSALISRVDTIASTEIIDSKTVAFNTKGPDPILPKRQFLVYIYPKHYFGDPAVGDTIFGTKPVGTGSYIVDEYSRGSRLKLKASPTSWHGTKGVDTVDLRVINDAQTVLAAYEAGDLDFAGVPSSDVERAKTFKNTLIRQGSPTGIRTLDIEYFDPPTKDPRVRLALNQALDWDAIRKAVDFGLGEISQGQLLTTTTFGWNPNLKAYKFNPDEARRLLKEAGYGTGFKTKLAFTTSVKTWVEACADYFKEIGVQTELITVDLNVWRDGLYGRRHREALHYGPWSSFAIRDASIAMQWFLSDNPGKYYNRPEFDSAYKSAITEIDDEKRKRLWWKATEVMNADPPSIWGGGGGGASAIRSDRIKSMPITTTYFDEILLA